MMNHIPHLYEQTVFLTLKSQSKMFMKIFNKMKKIIYQETLPNMFTNCY